jgi:hypothetical protein
MQAAVSREFAGRRIVVHIPAAGARRLSTPACSLCADPP